MKEEKKNQKNCTWEDSEVPPLNRFTYYLCACNSLLIKSTKRNEIHIQRLHVHFSLLFLLHFFFFWYTPNKVITCTQPISTWNVAAMKQRVRKMYRIVAEATTKHLYISNRLLPFNMTLQLYYYDSKAFDNLSGQESKGLATDASATQTWNKRKHVKQTSNWM